MDMKIAALLSLGLCGAFGGSAAERSTDTTNSVDRLPEVVVTATRVETDAHDVPYAVNVRRPNDPEQGLPRTMPEALKEVPSVMVQKTAHGQGSPFIRGFTGFRNVMLIDGIRLNNSVFREGPNQYWNTVDPLSIDRLEVVRGPSSVHYGSDAIGGAVNAFTLSRTDYEKKWDWDARTFYRVSSAERSHTGRAETSANLTENFGILLGGSLKTFGDVEAGGSTGKQLKTGYDEYDWDAKLEYFFSPNSRLVLAHQTVHLDDAWRTHRTIYGILWNGSTRGSDLELSLDQHRDLTYLQWHVDDIGGFIDEVHVSVSHHLQQEDELKIRNTSQRDEQGFDVSSIGLSLEMQSPSPVGRWVYGADFYHDWVDSYQISFNPNGTFKSAQIQGPVADDASYDLAGLFVEDNIPVGERLEFTVGGRYTYASADANSVLDPQTRARTSISDSWDTMVGSGRVLYHVDEEQHWNVFGGISQGFRAPNLSDLTRFDIAASGELETPSPNLQPEHFISYEIGVKTSYERATVQAGYFYTDISDLIVRTPTGRLVGTDREVVKLNSGEGHVHGIELDARLELHPQLTARGSATWMEGNIDTYSATSSVPLKRKEPLSRTMPGTLQLGLKWKLPSEKVWVEASTALVQRQERLSSADKNDTQRIPPGGTPGYAVCHLRGGWRPCRNVELAAAIENITDEDYRVHGSGMNEPGRNFIFSADFRF